MRAASRHRPAGRLRFGDGSKPSLRGRAREFGARALTTVYRRVLFLAYSLDGVRIPVYNAAIDVSFGVMSAADVPAYMRFKPNADRSEIERRLSIGNRCFVSWHRGEIVDACWTATGSVYVPYLERHLPIPQGDVYSFDSYTDPAYRGRGIYMARNSFTARQHQAEGLKRSIALVAYENYSAWLILTRSGLRTLGCYHYFRFPLGGVYWETTEPGHALPVMHPAAERAVSPAPIMGAAPET